MDFGAQDHHKDLLERFIVTENCIIAEIYRLSDLTPLPFIDPMASVYNKLIVDFSFFENKSLLEKYVDQSEEGRGLDEEFYLQFGAFLKQFSNLLDAIGSFIFDFVEYTEKCVCTQNPMDKRFTDLNVLKCEVLYLFGVMLLLLENEFPGAVKERIFVAFYRSRNMGIDSEFAETAISFLKSYTVLEEANFSHSHFNSDKLAAMIYTSLFFRPELLENNFSAMRQIVDKYFCDKWIISLHMGLKVNLREKWIRYKAAASAIGGVINEPLAMNSVALENIKSIRSIQLPSGLLTVESFGDYSRLIVEYDTCLRWLILHFSPSEAQQPQSKKSLPMARLSSKELLALLTKLSTFEYKFHRSCQFLIERKAEDSGRLKSRISFIFDQVVAFLANPAMDKQNWNNKLKLWMESVRKCVMEMDMTDANSPHVLEHLRSKLLEVAELHTGEYLVLRQYFSVIASELDRLMAICLVDVVFLQRLVQRTDATYLYLFLVEQLAEFELLLKQDALAVKYIFMKLSRSVANLIAPVRDAAKHDVLSTFYHKKLEAQLKAVIQTIPRAIFAGMDELQSLFATNKSIQVQKTNVKQLADLKRRHLLAKKTCEVTKLSQGISDMYIRQLGTIEIRPRELLHDGLCTELSAKLERIFNGGGAENILRTLAAQTGEAAAFRRAFRFVCEYIGANGCVMWERKVCELVGRALQAQLRAKNLAFPVAHMAKNAQSMTKRHIVSHLLDRILLMTNPMLSTYNFFTGEWQNCVNGKRLEFTNDVFGVVENWLPGVALPCLHRIVLHGLADLMQEFHDHLERASHQILSHSVYASSSTLNYQKTIETLTNSANFNELYKSLLPLLAKIGQLRILDENMAYAIDEQMKIHIVGVANASVNCLRNIETRARQTSLSKQENPSVKISRETGEYFANFSNHNYLLPEISIRNGRIASLIFFALIVTFFRNHTGSTKKVQQYDAYVILYGLFKVVEMTGLRNHFNMISSLFLNDSNVLSATNAKHTRLAMSLLKASAVAEALAK